MVLVPKSKSPNTIHHRKRTGAHHRQDKHYAKPYQPYLPIVGLIVVGLITSTLFAQHNTNVLGFATDVSATTLLNDTNDQRKADNEATLQANNLLMVAAQNKANDMVARNYWSHDTPDGKTPWSFISAAGYSYAAAGENLAYGFNSSSAIISGWMNSTEHRENMLNASFTDVGFGIANSSNFQGKGPETVIVAEYAEPAAITASSQHNVLGAQIANASPAQAGVQPAPQTIARVQEMAPGGSWSLFVVAAFGAVAVVWLITRHALAWKRALVHGEEFIIHHRSLDLLIVVVAVLGYFLTRTAGFIR